MEEDLLFPGLQAEEEELESVLRPKLLKDFIGQEKVKETLTIFIEAAMKRGEALDHLLFCGPPGLGKTTLAGIVANEMGVKKMSTSGPAIERTGDLAAILTNLEPGGVLFIDEIHRLSRQVEEILYPAMEDFQLDLVIGKGPSARSIKLEIPGFTLIGATTRTGLITSPLRDRFGHTIRMDYYPQEEIFHIIKRTASLLEITIDDGGAQEIAGRSRGTPRIANRLLKRVRDYSEVKSSGKIDREIAQTALDFFEVDRMGLDKVDRKILTVLIEKFGGAPVGLNTLAVSVGEEPQTLEDVYEPFLLQQGLIKRTPRGRVPTPAACEHLGFKQEGKLF